MKQNNSNNQNQSHQHQQHQQRRRRNNNGSGGGQQNGGNNNRRNNGGFHHQGAKSHYDSNGPSGRIRGTAQQIFEKYTQLARDALSSDDSVLAENLLQHAEHYYRCFAIHDEQSGRRQQQGQYQGGADQQNQLAEADGNQTAPSAADFADISADTADQQDAPIAVAPATIMEEAVAVRPLAPVAASDDLDEKPRKRGRPKGSRNRDEGSADADMAGVLAITARGGAPRSEASDSGDQDDAPSAEAAPKPRVRRRAVPAAE